MAISKTLSRIIKLSFEGSGEEQKLLDLDQWAQEVNQNIAIEASENLELSKKNLTDFLATIDKTISELGKTITLRDRTLKISSSELMTLNEQILERAKLEKTTIEKLAEILRLFYLESTGPTFQNDLFDEKANNLEKIVFQVDTLVRSQIRTTKKLALIFNEGLNISSSTSYEILNDQFQKSIAKLFAEKIEVELYFSGEIFEKPIAGKYFLVGENDSPHAEIETPKNSTNISTKWFSLTFPKRKEPLGLIKLIFPLNLIQSEKDEIIQNLTTMIPILNSTIENIRLNKEEKYKLHMASELLTARLVQEALLPPNRQMFRFNDFEICGFYQNAAECGGDWWTHFSTLDGRQIILVGDVTGHGTASAMVCALVKGYTESFHLRPNLEITQILSELNLLVHSTGKSIQRMMTMIAVVIDPKKNELTYSNAGHPHPILITHEGGKRKVKSLIGAGAPLGYDKDSNFQSRTQSYQKGDKLLLSSDGLLELIINADTDFGQHLSRNLLLQIEMKEAALFWSNSIFNEMQRVNPSKDLADDVTSVVVSFNHN